MHVTEPNRAAAERLHDHAADQKHQSALLRRIIADNLTSRLGSSRAEGSLRSILQHPQTFQDPSLVATRLLSTGEHVPAIIEELAHQACVAGCLWEEDELDFCDVTARVVRLQMIARQLSCGLERASRPTGHRIMLMPCPHETHVFGLQLLEMAFRDAGWAVARGGAQAEGPGALLARTDFDAVGLSLSNTDLLPHLRDAIAHLRRASRNQSLRVLVGGPCFDRGDADVTSVGADAYAPDACSAPMIAKEIVNEQKLICAGASIS